MALSVPRPNTYNRSPSALTAAAGAELINPALTADHADSQVLAPSREMATQTRPSVPRPKT
jgi:hypothetical protein